MDSLSTDDQNRDQQKDNKDTVYVRTVTICCLHSPGVNVILGLVNKQFH